MMMKIWMCCKLLEWHCPTYHLITIVMKMMPTFCKQSIQDVFCWLDEIIIARNIKMWSKQWWRRIWMCCKMLDKSCPTNHPTSRLFLADDSRCINWSLDSNIERNSHSAEHTWLLWKKSSCSNYWYLWPNLFFLADDRRCINWSLDSIKKFSKSFHKSYA